MIYKLYQRGALLIAAIVLVVIILVMVTAMSFLSVSNLGASGSHMSSAQAFYIANSGLERALYQFSKNDIACGSLADNQVVGAGSYTAAGTVYPTAANSTLSAAITNAATTIPVVSVTGYAPHGRILIESEEIDYSSTTTSAAVCSPVAPPCFIAYKRAANGTAAAAHGSGVQVVQPTQCLIRSTGTAGSAQRVLEAVVRKMSVQPGTAILPINVNPQSKTVNITSASSLLPVNPNRSFVVCQNEEQGSQNGSRITCELTSAGTLVITNGGTAGSAFVDQELVNWYVVEFLSGVTVQRGLAAFAAGTFAVSVPISAVTLANTFVYDSERIATNSNTFDERWTTTAQLNTTTNLALTRNESGTAASVAWQVIQHNSAAVQSNILAIAKSSLAASNPVALSPAVNLSKTFAVGTFRGGSGVDGEEKRYQTTGQFSDTTHLTFTRAYQNAASANTQVDIFWYAVAMSDATTVRSGSGTNAGAIGNPINGALSPVIVPSRSLPILSVRGDVSGGTTGDLDDTSYRAAFTSCTPNCSNLQMTRKDGQGGSTIATVAWFVVQFANQISLVDRVEYFP